MDAKHLNKHQIRSEQSKRKVIDAIVELVNETGFAKVTTARIADRAGVTWGVLQHQFGSKNSIFAAVIDTLAADFIAALDAIDTENKDLEATVEELISVFWSFFSRPVYRAALEILLNTDDESSGFKRIAQDVVAKDMYRCWHEHIRKAGCTSSDASVTRAGELMATTLSGYAIRIAIRTEEDPALEPQRAFLVKALIAVLSDG